MRKFTEKDIEEKLGICLTELFELVGKDAYLIIAVITCILAIISTILMIIELKK
jgi:hypothetical protein